MGNGDRKPASTLILPRLALDGMLFEIDAIAAMVDAEVREDKQSVIIPS